MPETRAGNGERYGRRHATEIADCIDGGDHAETHLSAEQGPVLRSQAAEHEAKCQPARDGNQVGLAIESRDQRCGRHQNQSHHNAGADIDPEEALTCAWLMSCR